MEVKQDREKLLHSEEYHVRLESLEWEIRAPQKSAWIKTDKYQSVFSGRREGSFCLVE